jgi:glycosyltransferase involved in cell wall biosynthesis
MMRKYLAKGMTLMNKKDISVIISTYNQPEWLKKTLWGYERQTVKAFELIIADDGSNDETKQLIHDFSKKLSYSVKHVWHEDNGFRKCAILNAAINEVQTDYLLFSDGDCIPRNDFVETHLRYRKKNCFLSGGYFKLPSDISNSITLDDIDNARCFDLEWLKNRGIGYSFKNNKLSSSNTKAWILNHFTTTKATWNGHNASGWKADIVAANGFDERMEYGGEDRELGERMMNSGIKGIQIRYSAICVHLYHTRGYVTESALQRNKEIRANTKKQKLTQTDYGLSTCNTK